MNEKEIHCFETLIWTIPKLDTLAQHCEIHSKDFLKENAHNFGKKLDWTGIWIIENIYTIAQHCEIHSKDDWNGKCS